jgi:4-amino-4-deoxy-L-arabinose transferase-like glycosyltransferase
VGLALLLAVFGVRLLDAAVRNAFTIDEPAYVGTGLYLWQSGDYHYARILHFHPPLAFHLASLPLLALDVSDVAGSPRAGRELLRRSDLPKATLRLASRLPFALLACWGAVLCFLWGREVAGDGAGLLAAFLYTFTPTLLGHGALAHSDIALAVFFLQTLYAFWRWMRRPGPLRTALCGISLGLALASKLTAILLLGILPLLAAVEIARRQRVDAADAAAWRDLARAALGVVAMFSLAALVIWLAYGGSFASLNDPAGRLPDLSLPAYVRSFFFVDEANAATRRIFFLGEILQRGPAWFFPVAFAVKEPCGMLALVGAALLSLRSRRGRLALFLAVPFAVYAGILVTWLDVPLGYRYALPLVPLVCVFTATQLVPVVGVARRLAFAAACLAIALESLWIHPHYLAFFNGLVGGPRNGHHLLLDSNLDWGQDVTTLARELERRGNPPVWLALFATERPADYGVRGRGLRGCEPVEGMLAISANVRWGLYAPHNILRAPQPGCYDWLDAHEPVARPGHSIWLYDLPKAATR